MKNKKKANIIDFPTPPSKIERQVEAILFAASEPLDVETIVCQPRIFSPGGSGSVFEFTETNIIYSLERSEEVTARIFNLSGRLKRTIKPEFISKGGHQVMNWDGKDSNGDIVPSGLYIVTLEKEDTILRTTVGVLNR